MQQLQRVIRGDYKIPSRVKISDPCRDLLDRILQVNVAKRITISEILKHKWCAQASRASLLCMLLAAPGVAPARLRSECTRPFCSLALHTAVAPAYKMDLNLMYEDLSWDSTACNY